MAHTVARAKDETALHATFDRREEWKQCCAAAMGFEWVDRFDDEEEEASSHPILQVINLLDKEDDLFEDDLEDTLEEQNPQPDPWMENAHRIQADVNRMTQWIRSKQYEFMSVDMPEEEASLIQSTVTTFSAATASDLETLRSMITFSDKNGNDNMASHRAGVVQILLEQLKEQVAEPFNQLQKQRTRMAVDLWQNPLQCRLFQPKQRVLDSSGDEAANLSSMMEQLLDADDQQRSTEQREQRFLPRNMKHIADANEEGHDFLATYDNTQVGSNKKIVPRRPEFVSQLLQSKPKKQRLEQELEIAAGDASGPAPNRPTTLGSQVALTKGRLKPQVMPYQQQPATSNPMSAEEYARQVQDDLRQEAALLQVSVQNDLDSVQKVEQRMVEITTLISQFSNLVSEQQESIEQIHGQAETAKKNISKGQENLVDATERTKQSKHYMAWCIFAMAMMLLFFHTVKG